MSDFRDVLKAQQGASERAGDIARRLLGRSDRATPTDMKELVANAKQAAEAARLAELERRERNIDETGDFVGQVVGTWVRVGSNGDGVVEYQGKEYITVRLGKTSLFPGDKVQLSYAKGTYFSSW